MAHCSGPTLIVRIASPEWLILSLILLAVAGTAVAASGNNHLDAIEVEADKVGAKPAAAGSDGGPGLSAVGGPMGVFELQLQDRFAGTHLICKRLPPESRDEIFREFKDGAPTEDVRRSIMSRFLHTR